jgi:D-glycero-alpha-D-manno-heptose 1-phosphate guanylyltransferase
MIPREAIILAGGFGTRLRTVVSDVPKPLAPVGGRPFLHWMLESLSRSGLERVIVATGYLGHMIEASLGSRFAGMDVVCRQETTPLGTGGCIWAALRHCKAERVFALNGDTWFGVSLDAVASAAPEADIVMAARPVDDRSRYGSLLVTGNRLTGMAEKGLSGPGLVNCGVYLFNTRIIGKRNRDDAFGLEQEIFERPEGLDIRVCVSDAPFLDIGTPDDYERAQAIIPTWASA